MMGSPGGEPDRDDDEGPRHEVRISQGFWMGRYEVTQKEWQAVMGENPSYFGECGARCPVEHVNWFDAQKFIERLNERDSGAYLYRLPTEAEWEYAARAGTVGARYGELADIAWYDSNGEGRTRPVGGKRANRWGLHDMLGNVYEWTADWFGGYSRGLVTDPRGAQTGKARVLRGGSCELSAEKVRSASRYAAPPNFRYSSFGLRVVRTE